MRIINRKNLLLDMGTLTFASGYTVKARRCTENPDILYVWGPGQDRAVTRNISDMDDLQEQINNLDFFSGTLTDAIRQGKVAPELAGQRLFWVPEEALPLLQAETIWMLSSGIYGEEELRRLLGPAWEAEMEAYEV